MHSVSKAPWQIGYTKKHVRSCAVVAPSLPLVGKGKGSKIDAHNWVLRLNRVPTASFTRDLGTRTDLLFLNCLRFRTGTVEQMGPPPRKCKDKYQCWDTLSLSNCNLGDPG